MVNRKYIHQRKGQMSWFKTDKFQINKTLPIFTQSTYQSICISFLKSFFSAIFSFDNNNDGTITLKEMKKFVKDIQCLLDDGELETVKKTGSIEQAFTEMDTDQDGKIDVEEFVTAVLGHTEIAKMLTLKVINVFSP